MRDSDAVVGYSGTSLTAKLGVKEGSTLALLDAPADLRLEVPPGVVVRHTARGNADVVLAFFTRASKVEPRLDRLGSMIFPSGALWIAWPKKSSGMESDITDVAVRGHRPPSWAGRQQGLCHRRDVVGTQIRLAPGASRTRSPTWVTRRPVTPLAEG